MTATTLLLLIFEPATVSFIDIPFEATSAFATVGVSTGITADLSPASQLVIIVTMFLGRVGPLTLLLALTRQVRDANISTPPNEFRWGEANGRKNIPVAGFARIQTNRQKLNSCESSYGTI